MNLSMMKNLQLSLTKEWFDQTNSGEKNEDYRKITPYWCAQLLLFKGKKQTRRFWYQELTRGFDENTLRIRKCITPCVFLYNIMTLGYPKETDYSRISIFEHKGIEINTGREEWGAEKGKYYFVIKHGKKMSGVI